MAGSGWRAKLGDWLWFMAWGVASSVCCVTAAGQLGATFDEPVYVARGLEHWRSGSYSGLLKLGTMPLPVDVATLPLYLWERWRGVPFDAEGDLSRLLVPARLGALPFWWLLLTYGRLAGRALGGPWGGRLAVAMLACEPSLLAHAGLATTDIAISAALLALIYHFRVGRDAGWLRRVGLPALWFGIAVLTKASGIAFGPLCLFAAELDWLRQRQSTIAADPGSAGWLARSWRALGPLRRDALQIGLLGLTLVFVYCGSDWHTQPSFVAWSHSLPEDAFGRSMAWLADHLPVFSNAGEGIVRQIGHNVRGHGAYLLGHSDPRAFWYYFPVLLTIKLTPTLLLAPLVLAVVGRRSLLSWATVATLLLLLFSLNCRVQIGVRLVLPLVTLAIVGLAGAAASAWQAQPTVFRRRLLAGAAALGVASSAAAAVRVWPNELCYVNAYWGGTRRGYQIVSESNYDWGQGLPELAAWQRKKDVDNLDIWYFGSDPSLKSLPMRHLPLQCMEFAGPEQIADQVRGRYLAVGTTILYGKEGETLGWRQGQAFLKTRKPVARTTTFLIYDFTREPDGHASRSP